MVLLSTHNICFNIETIVFYFHTIIWQFVLQGPGCKFNDKSKRVFLNQNQLQECDTLKDAWDLEDFVAACQVQKVNYSNC